MINLSSKEIKGLNSSKIAKSEKNDCFVRALAAATEVDYDTTHEVVKNVFNRKSKKGTENIDIVTQMLNAEKEGLQIGDFNFNVKVLGKAHTKNTYKLYGEYVDRKKTVKSFIQDHPKGNYVVTVSKHAFAVKDGKLVDNKGEEFRPTRKVDGAYKIMSTSKVGKQLSLFA